MNLTRITLATIGLTTLAALAVGCANPREHSAASFDAPTETSPSTSDSTTSSTSATSLTEWTLPWFDIVDNGTSAVTSDSTTTNPSRPRVAPPPTTPTPSTATRPSTPPATAPPPTLPTEYTITCWDGRTIVQWWPPTDEERLGLCGTAPTTTLPPPARVTQVAATYGNGLPWLGGGPIATPESCPTNTTIRFTATIADGSSETGSATMTATAGTYANATATLRGGQIIKFSLYLLPAGGCIRGVMYG